MSFASGPTESKGKGSRLHIPAEPNPKVEAMVDICKKWVSRKTMRPMMVPEVSDDELDRRANKIWENKASDPQLGLHFLGGRSRSCLVVP